MKIGIVGIGAVGAATAMAIATGGRVRELVLVNRNRGRAKGVATDMRYGLPLAGPIAISDGDYGDLSASSVVIVAAGINEKSGGATNRNDPAGRLRLLGANVKVYEDIVPKIVAAAPGAVILVATDPPDPLVDVARRLAKHARVMGTGTYLDSLRFRVHLAQRLGIAAASVEAYVIGEHGTSSVFVWSSAKAGGRSLREIVADRGIGFDDFRREIEHEVRYANISIIEGIGASYTASAWSPRASRKSSPGTSARYCLSDRTGPSTPSRCRCRAWSVARAYAKCSVRTFRTRKRGRSSAAPRRCGPRWRSTLHPTERRQCGAQPSDVDHLACHPAVDNEVRARHEFRGIR